MENRIIQRKPIIDITTTICYNKKTTFMLMTVQLKLLPKTKRNILSFVIIPENSLHIFDMDVGGHYLLIVLKLIKPTLMSNMIK